MTTLSAGSSVTLTLANNGFLEVATNGGLGSVTITPTGGAAVTESWGPSPFRKRWTGYPEGATAALSNSSAASVDYETDSSNLPATVQGLVSEAGNITAAELATTTGALGQTVRLSDGDNKGAILMWSTPAGSSTPAWCWWLWPQSPYEA